MQVAQRPHGPLLGHREMANDLPLIVAAFAVAEHVVAGLLRLDLGQPVGNFTPADCRLHADDFKGVTDRRLQVFHDGIGRRFLLRVRTRNERHQGGDHWHPKDTHGKHSSLSRNKARTRDLLAPIRAPSASARRTTSSAAAAATLSYELPETDTAAAVSCNGWFGAAR